MITGTGGCGGCGTVQVHLAIEEIGRRLAEGLLQGVVAVPACDAAAHEAAFHGLPLLSDDKEKPPQVRGVVKHAGYDPAALTHTCGLRVCAQGRLSVCLIRPHATLLCPAWQHLPYPPPQPAPTPVRAFCAALPPKVCIVVIALAAVATGVWPAAPPPACCPAAAAAAAAAAAGLQVDLLFDEADQLDLKVGGSGHEQGQGQGGRGIHQLCRCG